MSELGTLERIDLRDLWATEAQDFTPWLAQEHNLNALASVLGKEWFLKPYLTEF
jgi:hypothetical protein